MVGECRAGRNGNPVCLHRAALYLVIGALDLTPEPEPPAPANAVYFRSQGRVVACPVCAGFGAASPVAQAAALVAAADRLSA